MSGRNWLFETFKVSVLAGLLVIPVIKFCVLIKMLTAHTRPRMLSVVHSSSVLCAIVCYPVFPYPQTQMALKAMNSGLGMGGVVVVEWVCKVLLSV